MTQDEYLDELHKKVKRFDKLLNVRQPGFASAAVILGDSMKDL